MVVKGKGKKIRLFGFLRLVFICGVAVFPVYYIFSKLNFNLGKKDDICFWLYISLFLGTGAWLLYYLKSRNEDYDTIQMMMQPFVLIATFWGYTLDKFENRKGWIIAAATVVLTASFLINLIGYNERQNKKVVEVRIEKTATVYEVVLADKMGKESHYRITIRK